MTFDTGGAYIDVVYLGQGAIQGLLSLEGNEKMSPAESERYYLGIDIGSVSLSYVLLNQNRQILASDYLCHQGNIFKLLRDKLERLDLSRVDQVAYNHRSSEFFSAGLSVNEQVALIEGARFQQKNVGSLFTIGGETFGLILFDEKNRYQKYIANSSCAAGTGGFLDQQAERLGLSGSTELSQLADAFQGDPPKIATRCAVFAKTDLIHCQQQGHSIEAISAGLCKGLAHNIADTLINGIILRPPVVVVAGVSQNPKVMHYLSEIISYPTLIPEYAVLTGAIGCALIAQSELQDPPQVSRFSTTTLLQQQASKKHHFFAPLSAELSVIPDFTDHISYVSRKVEVDLYDLPQKKNRIPAYLGIDVGSTSTKAVVLEATDEEHILVGLYTRTGGQPIHATQALLRALREIEEEYELHFEFCGTGTTGSGRNFIQKVINGDLAVDEITAHARAAYALNPEVDTIIEIGGQDSKFTVMRNGQVTFSAMNYVCAAGTGSFLEEQAKRLNVPLNEYAKRAMGTASPLTSDRCTVFMERDLNHFMSQGYSKEELLAAALHSIRDNYLSKVAQLSKIGNVICFQGATAKNKALVAAFEQKLQKPIVVSKYCHLTGALGVCLLLMEKHLAKTRFRGIDFYKESPEVSEEVCGLCRNHCKLKRIRIGDECVMWGFMCGRDESSNRRISANQSGFDLLSSRRRIYNPSRKIAAASAYQADKTPRSRLDELKQFEIEPSFEKLRYSLELNLLNLRHKLFAMGQEETQWMKEKNEITIGLPNALYMLEFMPFWNLFFRSLGYKICTSSSRASFMEKGKEIAGAEFCAPITYWHGHVHDLSRRSDYLFLPHILQEGEDKDTKFYCYYSNYAVALLQNIKTLQLEKKCISPIIDFSKPVIHNVQRIYESLPQELKFIQTPSEIQEAYLQAWRWFMAQNAQLATIFQQETNLSEAISVVLLGRPYLILDPVLNKNIPQKFNEFGVKTFFQDMLPQMGISEDRAITELIDWNHWKYGGDILQAAEYIGKTRGLYPVLLSAFKCSPDSFVLSYFKEIMDRYQKPYLILQIDEHGSDVGYGTRVEAAIETFRNHFQGSPSVFQAKAQRSVLKSPLKEGTILVPNQDPLSCSLICAAFERAGYQTLLIEESPTTVVSSLRLNDGQCLPLSSIVQGVVETIRTHQLKPKNTTILMPAITRVACNFPQYPLMTKRLLEQRGDGFGKVRVLATESDLRGFPLEVIYNVYCAYLLGGLLRCIGCRLRPYESSHGQTDCLIDEARQRLYRCIADGASKERIFKEIVADFAKIPMSKDQLIRPKVAIIGDLYVRDNDVFNQQLISALEEYGAEVVAVPFNYVLRLLGDKRSHYLWENGRYLSLIRDKLLTEVFEKFEKRFYQIAKEVLGEEFPAFDDSTFDQLTKYNLSLAHGGETAQNLLKIFSLLKHYPDISLFVHVNPIFCCPGLVSESLFKTVEQDIGIPIISVVYDGTTTNKNELLAPYLHYILGSFAEREIGHINL
jgi:predicted CoA-substrate-specific enzyme activase